MLFRSTLPSNALSSCRSIHGHQDQSVHGSLCRSTTAISPQRWCDHCISCDCTVGRLLRSRTPAKLPSTNKTPLHIYYPLLAPPAAVSKHLCEEIHKGRHREQQVKLVPAAAPVQLGSHGYQLDQAFQDHQRAEGSVGVLLGCNQRKECLRSGHELS